MTGSISFAPQIPLSAVATGTSPVKPAETPPLVISTNDRVDTTPEATTTDHPSLEPGKGGQLSIESLLTVQPSTDGTSIRFVNTATKSYGQSNTPSSQLDLSA